VRTGGFFAYGSRVSIVQWHRAASQTTDKGTAELLSASLGGPALDTAEIDALADAIDAGHFARSVALPDHEPTGLAIPAEAMSRMAGMFELVRRASVAPPPTVIRGSADVVSIAERELGGRNRECVLIVVCDAGNRVIRTKIVSRGAVDRALFPVREILSLVLQNDGRAFAIAHNHPQATIDSSQADDSASRRIESCARVLGVRFLGAVVVSAADGSALQPNAELRVA
jgi:DNA repair protein RadC